MTKRSHSHLILFQALFCYSLSAHAEFQPIELTADSYNQDLIVENTASPPVVPVTSASMEEGAANLGTTWYEQGYVKDWPVTGIPPAGLVFASEQALDHLYQMPPSYHTNNAFLIDGAHPSTMITLVTPSNYTALSVLTSSAPGGNLINYRVHHRDGTTQSGTFTSPPWYNGGDPAWAANGRVDVIAFFHADVNSYNPRLYSVDISLVNMISPISNIDLSLASGSGHTVIFAVSGAPAGAGPYVPIEIRGYNEDLVVEANAVQTGFLETYTTATMDNGTDNLRCTWYEQGYFSASPESGLPPAGSVIRSGSDSGHQFRLPASYTQANAILLDASCKNANLGLRTPARYSALSFLTASGHGPVTNRCITAHANGSYETNWFVSPDWLSSASEAEAIATHGRVSVSTKLVDQVNTDRPRLYAVDVPIANQTSWLTNITVSVVSASPNAHAAILAVSGISSEPPSPIRPQLTIEQSIDGSLFVHSTQPGRLQSCAAILTTGTNWREEGPILSTAIVLQRPIEPARYYRVVLP